VSTRDVYTESSTSARAEDSGGAAQQVSNKAREASEQARDSAQQAAGQAQSRVRQEVDTRTTQLGDQMASTAQDVRSVGEELRKQGKDGPARLADQAAERAERVADYMKRADADSLVGELESFARQRPWAVMVGGLTLGFLASRFIKASGAERYKSRSGNGDLEADWSQAPASTFGATTSPAPASTAVDTGGGYAPVTSEGSGRPVTSDPFADDPVTSSPAIDDLDVESRPRSDDPWGDPDERRSSGL
jgi:hypothetical protein